jgi:hypothetical protein
MATHVYIDGPSLYYGALKDRIGRWLDLQVWCEQLLPGLDVARIDYFTAWAPHSSPGAVLRQRVYVRALATSPKTTTHFGRFERDRLCDVAVVVTSNSELRIPIAAVRERGVRVGIVNPRPGRAGNAVPTHDARRARNDHRAARVGAALRRPKTAKTRSQGAGLPPSRQSGPGCVLGTLGPSRRVRQ